MDMMKRKEHPLDAARPRKKKNFLEIGNLALPVRNATMDVAATSTRMMTNTGALPWKVDSYPSIALPRTTTTTTTVEEKEKELVIRGIKEMMDTGILSIGNCAHPVRIAEVDAAAMPTRMIKNSGVLHSREGPCCA
jgi:hypothetical protein